MAAVSATDLAFSGKFTGGASATVSASVTQTRVGGTALTNFWNNVTTVGTTGDAVTLGALGNGQAQVVFNNGANSASVFPNGASDTIDGGSAGAAVTLGTSQGAIYVKVTTNTIISLALRTGAGTYTGTFNGVVGGVTPAAATVTTLNATGLATLTSATLSGYFQGSVAPTLTAVGTDRSTALLLAKQYNVITSAASTAVGVTLPVGVIGMEVDINLLTAVTAATIHIYASGSDTVDTQVGSTGVLLTKGKVCRYKFVAANTWVSSLWGAVSS